MNDTRTTTCAVANSLQIYLREIRAESLLTMAEECILADAIARGDGIARTRMIRANLRLVVKIAVGYVRQGMSLEDLVGEGNLGLIRAVEEFDPRFGTRFATYAIYWIKHSIRHALINTTPTIRLPAHLVKLMNKWRRAERTLYREWGRMPSFDELSSFLGLSETRKSMVTKAHHARHVATESGIGTEGRTWASEETSNRYETVESNMEADEQRQRLFQCLERLNLRERTILALRYGMEGEPSLTLSEIGRRLGMSRQAVRNIEIRAIRRLHIVEDDDRGIGSRGPNLASGHCGRR